MLRHSGGRPPDPRRARLLVLAGAVALAAALPLTVAFAGPVGDEEGPAVVRASEPVDDKGAGSAPTPSPRLLGLGLDATARCGPELTSPDGIEAQTCVLRQGKDTWARTYYRNATGDGLSSVLSLLAPGGRTVQIDCVVDAQDDPKVCETPRERTTGEAGAYTAVTEFAKSAGGGPLLLRSGSNSTP